LGGEASVQKKKSGKYFTVSPRVQRKKAGIKNSGRKKTTAKKINSEKIFLMEVRGRVANFFSEGCGVVARERLARGLVQNFDEAAAFGWGYDLPPS
jgi:hypothetical protein